MSEEASTLEAIKSGINLATARSVSVVFFSSSVQMTQG